jgi:hypothetical protein
MNADRLSGRRQRGVGRRFLLAELAAGGLALVLLVALYLATPPSASRSLDKMPPTSAVASLPERSGPAAAEPHHHVRVGDATFHEDADLKDVPVEPDPSPRAVASYGN